MKNNRNERLRSNLAERLALGFGITCGITMQPLLQVRAAEVSESAGQVINQRLAELDSMNKIINTSGPLTSDVPTTQSKGRLKI